MIMIMIILMIVMMNMVMIMILIMIMIALHPTPCILRRRPWACGKAYGRRPTAVKDARQHDGAMTHFVVLAPAH